MIRKLLVTNVLLLGLGTMLYSSWPLLGFVLVLVSALLIMSLLVYVVVIWLLGGY